MNNIEEQETEYEKFRKLTVKERIRFFRKEYKEERKQYKQENREEYERNKLAALKRKRRKYYEDNRYELIAKSKRNYQIRKQKMIDAPK